jgi:hypothetical protein
MDILRAWHYGIGFDITSASRFVSLRRNFVVPLGTAQRLMVAFLS